MDSRANERDLTTGQIPERRPRKMAPFRFTGARQLVNVRLGTFPALPPGSTKMHPFYEASRKRANRIWPRVRSRSVGLYSLEKSRVEYTFLVW